MKPRLLRRYQSILGSAYVFCLVIAALLLFLQYRAADELRRLELEHRIAHDAQSVDLLLARSVAHVQLLRRLAEGYLSEHGNTPAPMLYRLEDRGDGTMFRAVRLPEYPAPGYGDTDLSGAGSAKKRAPELYREVAMALALTPAFHAVRQNMPEAAWVYYTSAQGFINLYPARAGNEWFYTPDVLGQAFYLGAKPDNNPTRRVFWTPVYEDLAGLGPMVTCSAPVDEGGRFLGTVALDLTLQSMESYLRRLGDERGSLFLVQSGDGRLLTQPKLPPPLPMEQLTGRLLTRLKAAPAGRFSLDEPGHTIEAAPLANAPWLLVYMEAREPLLASEARRPLLVFFSLALAITGLIVLAHWTALREFVRPAAQLVEHLQACSQGQIRASTAPPSWRPWFALVSETFREKQRLVTELRDHNERLDELVRKRTAEVETANRELKLLLEHLNRARLEMLRSQQELQEKNRKLEDMASHDGLTGLANRACFDHTLDAEWHRMLRAGRPLSLLMVDIDHFKAYNDNLGHQAGDQVLTAVAQGLAHSFRRAGELVARYGGEEFAVLLPDVGEDDAVALAEAARANLRGLAIVHPGSEGGYLSASFGVASVFPVRQGTAVGLLARADAALYRAKAEGRDCVRRAQ